MKATGPYYDQRKADRGEKPWSLGGLKVPVKNPDGTDKRDASGAIIFRRHRMYFSSEKAARAEMDRLNGQHESTGSTDLELVLNREQISDYAAAKRIIGNTSMESVARFWRQHHPDKPLATCATLVAEFLDAYFKRLVSDATDLNGGRPVDPKDVKPTKHLNDLRSRLGTFAASTYGSRYPKTVTRNDILIYVDALREKNGDRPQARTRWNHKSCIGIFFAYLLDKGLVDANPVAGIKKKQIGTMWHLEPKPLKLDQVIRYLRAFERYDKDLVAHEVIQLFAGVRSDEEMADFRAEFVQPKTKSVVIPAQIAKTAQRAVISNLEPNFWVWWGVYGKKEGLLRSQNYEPRWNRIRVLMTVQDRRHADELARLPIKTLLAKPAAKKALEDWPWNSRRRTFCSYHVAKHTSADKTALILRHEGSVETLHKSYRGRDISIDEGELYFNILPEPSDVEISPEIEPTGIVKLQRDARLRATEAVGSAPSA